MAAWKIHILITICFGRKWPKFKCIKKERVPFNPLAADSVLSCMPGCIIMMPNWFADQQEKACEREKPQKSKTQVTWAWRMALLSLPLFQEILLKIP